MSLRWHVVWSVALGAVLLAALVVLVVVIKDTGQSSWLCAHHWRSC